VIQAEDEAPPAVVSEARRPGPGRRWVWLGVAPFFVYAFAFLLYPGISILIGAFQPGSLDAYWTSVKISAATALLGGLFGLLLAYAAIHGGLPRWVRTTLSTFSGVAANFAGVPLAFAFISTIGFAGIVTQFLNDSAGFDLYETGFSLYSFAGLVLVYLYFQIPLMVLVISPALDGLRREWREAALNLGASPSQYWRHVALPVLLPSLLGAAILLFGSAFGAYATAYALTAGRLPLVPLLIGQVTTGNVLSDPHYGDALALGMVVVLGVTMTGYVVLQRKVSRWQR
jgi:putative spermidine/putrescine transport system permease protein